MSPKIDEVTRQSDRLLRASKAFKDSLAGSEADRVESERELVGAVPTKPALSAVAPLDADHLAAVLLELQSGNLLLAAAVQTQAEELHKPLDRARQQMQTAKTQLTGAPAPQHLAALSQPSDSLPAAKQAFRDQSGKFLNEVVDEIEDTIKAALDQIKDLLKKVGGKAAKDLINEIGTSFPSLAEAGSLVRRGLQSIKRALEALANWLGGDSLSAVKPDLEKLWDKLREEGGRTLLEYLIGADVARSRVDEALGKTTRVLEQVDEASNTLPPISGNFLREIRLVRLIVRGLALAGVLVGAVFAATVWVPLVWGGALFAAIAAALVIGGEYTGGRRLLRRVHGLEQVAEKLEAA